MSAQAKTKGGVRMGDIRGEGRHQTYLLPDTSDEDLGEEHPVRVLAAFGEPLALEP
jgi:hypothetical protein